MLLLLYYTIRWICQMQYDPTSGWICFHRHHHTPTHTHTQTHVRTIVFTRLTSCTCCWCVISLHDVHILCIHNSGKKKAKRGMAHDRNKNVILYNIMRGRESSSCIHRKRNHISTMFNTTNESRCWWRRPIDLSYYYSFIYIYCIFFFNEGMNK